MCLFVSMVEYEKGGSVLPVFEAFKLTIDDMDGKRIFPVPPEFEYLLTGAPEVVYEPSEEEEDHSTFSLGSGD
jgi:hypothetical protein